jgi:hypothetical protein
MEKIVPYAEKIRAISQKRAEKAKGLNRSYKNQSRVNKLFQLGQIVAHRQLQVATGSGMGMKPRFNGPYVIVEFDDDNVSATIEHLHTKKQMKAHFTNMSIVNFHPKSNRVHSEFDNELLDMIDLIDHKSTVYSKTKRPINILIDQMDDSPTDSVRANFVDNSGPIDTAFADEIYTDTIDDNTQNIDHNIDTGVLIDADDFSIPHLDNSDEFNTNDFEIHDDESLENYFNDGTQGDSDEEMEVNDKFVSHRNRPLTPYRQHETQEKEEEENENDLFSDFQDSDTDETLSADKDDLNRYID